MSTRKLKEGRIRRLKSSLFGKKWKECYAALYDDSTFTWYDEQRDRQAAGSLFLRDVVPYVAIGLMTDRMPVRRPQLPAGCSVHHLMGIGTNPRADKVYWFLFASDSDLESWITEITKTLPQVPPQPPTQQPQAAGNPPYPTAPPPAYNPPPVYPSGPPPVQGYPSAQYPTQAGYAPQAAGYAPQAAGYGGYPQQTTVIVDRGYDRGSNIGGLGIGAGLGGGLLMGSLLGYGLGSYWGHGWGGGGWGGGGWGGGWGGGYGGPGFGGGYMQDNDTFITNNYYGNGDGGTNAIANTDTSVTDTGNQDYGGYDSGGGWGYDGGGGDFGGGDFGGGDFGGGDFGGGDFGGGDF